MFVCVISGFVLCSRKCLTNTLGH